jgi:hypothetical protein
MNPGVNPYPYGLFWTVSIPMDSVEVHPGAGEAIYKASNLLIQDWPTFDQSLSGSPGAPAIVSFEVRWSGADQHVNIKDSAARFGGEFVRGSAQMEWTASVGDYRFQSDPIDTSFSSFASVGTERNGVFFPRS